MSRPRQGRRRFGSGGGRTANAEGGANPQQRKKVRAGRGQCCQEQKRMGTGRTAMSVRRAPRPGYWPWVREAVAGQGLAVIDPPAFDRTGGASGRATGKGSASLGNWTAGADQDTGLGAYTSAGDGPVQHPA